MRVQAILLLAASALPALTVAFAPSSRRSFFPTSTVSTSTSSASASASALFSSAASVELADGLLKTVSVPGQGEQVKLGDIATVKYSCYIPDTSSTNSLPFAKSSRQKTIVGDGGMIDAWEKAIRTMRVGERSIIRVTDPNMAYGAIGVAPLVPPNAVIEMDLEILEAGPAAMNIDFDSLAMADNTPRTANDIAAAYQVRVDEMSLEPELDGLDYWIDKFRNYYFFGLFEGETGEKAPWFLRPSITFPLAFAIVGAAFYVSYAGGAISERGAQVKDELDEIVLSSNMILTNPAAVIVAVNALLGTTTDLGM